MPFLPLPKAKAKLLRKLEQRKYRQEFQLFVAEGYRSIHQIVESSPDVISFVVRSSACSQPDLNVETYQLPESEFAELSSTEHSQGILAVVAMPKQALFEDILANNSFVLALDAIQDPGNLGTIIRNSIWFGVDSLLLGTGTVDVFNPKVIRSCMSNLHGFSYLNTDLSPFFDSAEKQGWSIFLLRLDSSAQELNHVRFPKKSIVVIGNEGNGIHSDLITPNRKSVFIPSFAAGEVESLNASVASALALYAWKTNSKS